MAEGRFRDPGVIPSVLRLNQNTKSYHEHHVYVLLHVVNEKLNFIALILKLSSNLFLVQILFCIAQLTIVILIQLHLSLFIFFLIPVARTSHMLCLAHAARAQRRPTVATVSHTLRINLNHKLCPPRTPLARCLVALQTKGRHLFPHATL